MTITEDLFLRQATVMSFEGSASDADGHPVKTYSIVTPISSVSQHFEAAALPIVVTPGDRLVVLGAADGDMSRLWLEIDEKTHEWSDATLVLAASQVRYLCEVGDDLHLKARH